jgi:hypothetical protein
LAGAWRAQNPSTAAYSEHDSCEHRRLASDSVSVATRRGAIAVGVCVAIVIGAGFRDRPTGAVLGRAATLDGKYSGSTPPTGHGRPADRIDGVRPRFGLDSIHRAGHGEARDG